MSSLLLSWDQIKSRPRKFCFSVMHHTAAVIPVAGCERSNPATISVTIQNDVSCRMSTLQVSTSFQSFCWTVGQFQKLHRILRRWAESETIVAKRQSRRSTRKHSKLITELGMLTRFKKTCWKRKRRERRWLSKLMMIYLVLANFTAPHAVDISSIKHHLHRTQIPEVTFAGTADVLWWLRSYQWSLITNLVELNWCTGLF